MEDECERCHSDEEVQYVRGGQMLCIDCRKEDLAKRSDRAFAVRY